MRLVIVFVSLCVAFCACRKQKKIDEDLFLLERSLTHLTKENERLINELATVLMEYSVFNEEKELFFNTTKLFTVRDSLGIDNRVIESRQVIEGDKIKKYREELMRLVREFNIQVGEKQLGLIDDYLSGLINKNDKNDLRLLLAIQQVENDVISYFLSLIGVQDPFYGFLELERESDTVKMGEANKFVINLASRYVYCEDCFYDSIEVFSGASAGSKIVNEVAFEQVGTSLIVEFTIYQAGVYPNRPHLQ